MMLSNITSIHKNKGSRLSLENDRGIFIQTVLKEVLDKLFYAGNIDPIDQAMSDSNNGAWKQRNIRDHLFILYAVINSVIKGGEECIDIQVYDIQKAFDSLWIDDTFNDLYDILPNEKRNDQISLLYNMNISNLVAINTPVGLSQRIDMPRIIQQGGVWGSILCSNTIDSIGRKCDREGKHLYMYKKRVSVLPLGFVDDLNGIARCGSDSLHLNIFLNSEIELKKLTFHQSEAPESSKCLRMHVGHKKGLCPPLKVHNQYMANVSEITYLGDRVSADGKNTKNVAQRTQKGTGIICQIMKVIRTVNFGYHTVEIAILMRESILLNGILTNIEVWHNITNSEIQELEKIDRHFLQKVLCVPKSVPIAALYLETGLLPISVIIKVRRLNYFHTILTGPSNGMLFKVFKTQWNFPCKGDWTLLVKKDLDDFDIESDLTDIKLKSKETFKKLVKSKARDYAYDSLCNKQKSCNKMENLTYFEHSIQKYMVNSDYSYNEVTLIFKFRTRMLNFGQNFRAGRDVVWCPLCHMHIDSQMLILQCPVIEEALIEQFSNLRVMDIRNLFNQNIKTEVVQALKSAIEVRDKKLV